MAFNPADDDDPIIEAPPAPPPPPLRAPPANTYLRDQHVHSVVAFHRASRPGRRYFVNSFEEFLEYVKTNNSAATAVNPAGVQWLATSSWEAFWSTYLGRGWRGLPRLRANAYLMTLIKSLDINMPPAIGPPGDVARVQAFGVDPAEPVRNPRRVAFAIDQQLRGQDARAIRAMAQELRAENAARRAAVAAEQAARREEIAARLAAMAPDEAQANVALERLEVPARPPPGQVAAPHLALGIDRPNLIHHLYGMDLLLAEHLPENGRRGMMRAVLGVQTDREADILYGNLRRAYSLDMVRPEVPPTAAELARMDVMRHAWALLNEGRQALFAAQAHQLPVAEFDLPDVDVDAQPAPRPVFRGPVGPAPPIFIE